MNRPVCVISSTFDKFEDAERIGRMLLDSRNVACAQISSPITSLYRWNNSLERSEEVVLTLKTLPGNLLAAQSLLESLHPYETPEILVRSDCEVSEKYYGWMLEEIQQV